MSDETTQVMAAKLQVWAGPHMPSERLLAVMEERFPGMPEHARREVVNAVLMLRGDQPVTVLPVEDAAENERGVVRSNGASRKTGRFTDEQRAIIRQVIRARFEEHGEMSLLAIVGPSREE